MDTANATSPALATNSTSEPPPDNAASSPSEQLPAKNATSPSPPPPSPPDSSPPPPESPPPTPSPPPATPPPPKSESPPKSVSPPNSESPPPPKEMKSPPPPPVESSPPPPSPANFPSPEKSPSTSPVNSPATPPPATSSISPSPPPPPPPPNVAPTPPAAVENSAPVFSPPPPVKSTAAASPPRTPPSNVRLIPSGNSDPVSSSSSVHVVVIVAAAAIGVAILAAVIICLVCAAKKKKKKDQYANTPSTRGPNGDYYNASNWNTPKNLRPPPGLMVTPPAMGWSPSPPPPGNSSNDFSDPHPNTRSPSPNMALSNQSSFSYEELAKATDGFAQDKVIGQGGFGYVHKGVLPDGKVVAVKSLKAGSGQGEREFQAEVEIISRVHHRHLVSLVGYCIADEQRMLVYEFVPNKTLEFHLHGKDRPTMDWLTRMRIALGAAKGLSYLHEDCHPRIIHRDIKAANILLDSNFEAMVADFGLAKLTSDNYTHISTRVMGTFGYMAPEYASSGKLTDKSDVFSFGVMMLELITGRRPIDLTNKIMEDSLADWARPILGRVLEDHNYKDLVDPRLENNFDPDEMNRMIACAAASIRHSATRRPKMIQIVRSLEGDQQSLDDAATKSSQTPETAVYDTTAYNADMMKFKNMITSSNDFGSNEFEHTSEYGLNPSSSSSEMASSEFVNSSPQRQRL